MTITHITLLAYISVLFLIILISCRKQNIQSYLVNEQSSSLLFLTLSNAASFIGIAATVTIVSSTYSSGIALGVVTLISLFAGQLMLGVIAPKIKEYGVKYGCVSMVDVIAIKYDSKCKAVATLIQLMVLMLWAGIQLMGGALLVAHLLHMDFGYSVLLVAGVSILYSAIGGIKADILTDFLQFIVFFVLFLILFGATFFQQHTMVEFVQNVPAAHFNVFSFKGPLWFFFGCLIAGFIYISNTSYWQRIMTAKSFKIAKLSCYLSAPLSLVISLIVIYLGLYAKAFEKIDISDDALFILMANLLPDWLLGLGYAAVIAILMSSLDSNLVSGASIIYRQFVKDHTKRKNVWTAKLLTLVFSIITVVITLLFPNIVDFTLFTSYLVLTMCPTVIVLFYFPKISAHAVFASMLFALMLLFILYPILGANTFVITVTVGVLVISLYDKVFKNKKLSNA